MNSTIAILILFGLGLLSLIIGVVILVRKQFLLYGRTGDFIGKVSGKKARSEGISRVLAGLLFLALSIAMYLWGR